MLSSHCVTKVVYSRHFIASVACHIAVGVYSVDSALCHYFIHTIIFANSLTILINLETAAFSIDHTMQAMSLRIAPTDPDRPTPRCRCFDENPNGPIVAHHLIFPMKVCNKL